MMYHQAKVRATLLMNMMLVIEHLRSTDLQGSYLSGVSGIKLLHRNTKIGAAGPKEIAENPSNLAPDGMCGSLGCQRPLEIDLHRGESSAVFVDFRLLTMSTPITK